MIGQLRTKVKKSFSLLAKPFVALRIHPNIVSFLGVPLALISAYFILQNDFTFALIFAILAVTMDMIDGSVATLLNKRSNFGNYFETMIDKIVEVILIAPFAFLYPLPAFLAVSFSLIASYAKPRVALVIITDNRDWPAIGEHGDRLLLLLLGLFISIFYPVINSIPIMELVLYLIFVMTATGTIQRIFYAKKLIEEAEKKGNLLPYIKENKDR